MTDSHEPIEPRTAKFKRGDLVRKVHGYPFPGIVDCAFTTQAGFIRYVVELVIDGTETGLLHVFSESNLEYDTL